MFTLEHTPERLVAECRRIVLDARDELGDIPTVLYLDLVADNLPDGIPLDTLRAALVLAGVGYYRREN